MSYLPVQTLEPDEVVSETTTTHINGPSTSKRPGKRLFQSANAIHTAISIAAGTVMALFGYEQGVFGGIIVGEDFLEYFDHPSPAMQGFVTSVYDLGCCAGAILTLAVGEKLGRKRMLIIFTLIMGAGILVQTASHNMQTMIWGRLIAGIGNGGNTATAPVWHVETSHSSAKGSAVVKEMAVNVLGFLMSNIITLIFSPLMTEAQWRFPLGIQMLFVAVILTMVPLLPESPRWLLARKRDDEAREVMNMLSEHSADEEFEEIRKSVKAEQAAQGSWSQLLRFGTPTRRVLLGMLLQAAQQLGGVLAYYLPVVLNRSVGLSELTSRLVACGNAISFFLATSVSIVFVDKISRRKLLMIGAAAMSISFFGVSCGVGFGLITTGHAPGIVAVFFIWLFFVSFSFGWISIPWLYPAEVNSLRFRTKGAALATAMDWIFNWAVVQTTPIGIHYLQWGLYLIYAVFNALFVPLVYFLVVETQGKSLEETDIWFERNPKWLVHKADHSVHRLSTTANRRKLPQLQVADDHEAMMRSFEISADGDEVSSPESLVLRRGSYPMLE